MIGKRYNSIYFKVKMNKKLFNKSIENPLVSVIMNCLNGEKYLKEAVDSIYAQTYKNWEIIFWDNASTDNSAKIAKSYDNRLRYFKSKKTLSLGLARNRALEQTKGEFIAFLDCDDIWLPYKLDIQLNYWQNHPEKEFLYSNAYVMQGEKKRLVYSKYFSMPQGLVFKTFLNRYPVNLQTVLVKKTSINNLDYWFDENLNLCEEYDFFLRLLYKIQAGYCREPLAGYRLHSDMYTAKKFHKFKEEKLYILNKFSQQIPNFNTEYEDEINLFQRGVRLREATDCILQGKKREARNIIQPYIFMNIKHFLTYFMTYVPLFMYIWLHEMKGGILLRQRSEYLSQKAIKK